jgi:hypothetical protein
MAGIIQNQNKGILAAWTTYKGVDVDTNQHLSKALNISVPPEGYFQNYPANDIKVKVI